MNNEIIESIPELNSSFPKNFGEIFIFIGKNIVNLVDFDNGNQLDKYLLGTTCNKLNHSGFLHLLTFKTPGSKCFKI